MPLAVHKNWAVVNELLQAAIREKMSNLQYIDYEIARLSRAREVDVSRLAELRAALEAAEAE